MCALVVTHYCLSSLLLPILRAVFVSLQLLGVHLSILQEALTHRKIEARSEEVLSSWNQCRDRRGAVLPVVFQLKQIYLAVLLIHVTLLF